MSSCLPFKARHGHSMSAFDSDRLRRPRHKHLALLENVSLFMQICVGNARSRDDVEEGVRFSGTEAVDLVFDFLKDWKLVEEDFAPPTKEITRNSAAKICQSFFEKGILQAVSSNGSLIATSSLFLDSQKHFYRFPRTDDLSNEISDLLNKCSISDGKRLSTVTNSSLGSSSSNGTQSSGDIRGDAFADLFGSQPYILEDEASLRSAGSAMSLCSSSPASDSDSVKMHEFELGVFWETHFQDFMELWRATALEKLLARIDVPVLEDILKPPKDTETRVFEMYSVDSGLSEWYQHSRLPVHVRLAGNLLGHSPQFGAALSRLAVDLSDVHPLTFVKAVHVQSVTLLTVASGSPSFPKTVLTQIGLGSQRIDGLYPAKHEQLLAALHRMLLLGKPVDQILEAFQLYHLFLPWLRRDYLRRLLQFLLSVCDPKMPLLRRLESNKDFVLGSFCCVVFPSNSDAQQRARNQELLSFIIEHADRLFLVPQNIREVIRTRFADEFVSPQVVEGSPNLYCELSMTERALVDQLRYVQECRSLPEKQRKSYLTHFKRVYPDIWKRFSAQP